MSKIITAKIKCPKCNTEQESSVYSSMNVTLDPNLKEKIKDGSFNLFECNKCKAIIPVEIDCLYHNMDKGSEFAVWYTPRGVNESHRRFTEMGNRLLGENNYMNRTLFLKDRLSFLLGVRLCETDGAPKTQEDVKKYYVEISRMRDEYSSAIRAVYK